MCLFENTNILETGIKMMQPDMIRTINGYKAYYVNDDMISQIYTFEVKKEKLILDMTVPDARAFFKHAQRGTRGSLRITSIKEIYF